jgi:hypothetical protein
MELKKIWLIKNEEKLITTRVIIKQFMAMKLTS